jgi:hypothetical protein
MYSPSVTQKQIEKVEAHLRIKLERYPIGKIEDWISHLFKIAVAPRRREWTPEEIAFIRNEQILCKLDFDHFSRNYCKILLGGINQSGLGNLEYWESQNAILRLISKLEEESWEAFSRNEPCDGILICLNKARQLGATAVCRAIIMHRIALWDHVTGFSASVDDDKILELYDRDKRIYDNLPFIIKPSLDPRLGSIDQQSQYLKFGKIDSSILYQTASQKSGLGQGRKFDVSHITEAASFPAFGMIEHDFLPTLPQNPTSFCVLESTPQGRGNPWHTWSEMVRKGKMARWHYLFIPVYIEKKKYRRIPPFDWTPAEHTLKYASKIESTSPEVVGYKHIPDRSFLFWWETLRREYAERGSLNIFLTNYAATPEESFQFVTSGALNPELLEDLSMDILEPVSYEFERSV